MKNKRLWILLGGIALGSLAFLLLNFRLALSNTRAETLLMTTDLGDNLPVSMQRNDKIRMVMLGESPLVRPLQNALIEKMDEAGLPELEPVQELEPGYQNPVLVVKVGKAGPIWTPFFAMSEFPIHAGYASNGDSTFMEVIEKTRTSVGKKDVSNMYAGFEVRDLSLGLISRPGYHQFLADYLAREIVAGLKVLYQG